jgi:MOSC domain-containing protein YiiM
VLEQRRHQPFNFSVVGDSVKSITAVVESVYLGPPDIDDLAKQSCTLLEMKLDGIVGDRHGGQSREAWEHDKQAEGTVRRNERLWSAVSVEELEEINRAMDLNQPLTAADLGANICIRGIPNLSQLAKGSTLVFSSGAELIVEEYNPPCLDMGEKLAGLYTDKSGQSIANTAFSQAAKFTRGVVGVVEVAGVIKAGDEVVVTPYKSPIWIERLSKS